MSRSIFLTLILATMLSGTVASAQTEVVKPGAAEISREASHQRTNTMRIHIRLEDRILTATLEDTATSRDFVSLLPLTLTLEDYAATEKISNLPRRLSKEPLQEVIRQLATSLTIRRGETWRSSVEMPLTRAG